MGMRVLCVEVMYEDFKFFPCVTPCGNNTLDIVIAFTMFRFEGVELSQTLPTQHHSNKPLYPLKLQITPHRPALASLV